MNQHIIVIANHKGGTGKTTLSTLLAIGLQNKNYQVVHIDLDAYQGSASNFWLTREPISKEYNLKTPEYNKIYFSKNNDKFIASQEDNENLNNMLIKYKDKNFIILDTAGSENNFTSYSINKASCVITPVTDSPLDISSIISKDNEYKYGPFAKFIFDHKINQMRTGNIFEWIVVRNKIPVTPGYNFNTSFIEKASKNLQFYYYSPIYDREIYRKTFDYGVTTYDLTLLDSNPNSVFTNLTAYNEIDKFINFVINKTLKL